ncbi:MAG TPA: hypothetical protein VF746_11330 [Longimicrobium sp.]|jgi:hypothetical protein
MSKAFDAVRSVREIRDAIYEETKSMTPEQYQAYIERRAAQAREQAARLLRERRLGKTVFGTRRRGNGG